MTGRPRKKSSKNVTDTQLPTLPSTSIHDSTALAPSTNGGQQSQTDQPSLTRPPTTSSPTPFETEIERLQKEREQITKSHQEKVFLLFSLINYSSFCDIDCWISI